MCLRKIELEVQNVPFFTWVASNLEDCQIFRITFLLKIVLVGNCRIYFILQFLSSSSLFVGKQFFCYAKCHPITSNIAGSFNGYLTQSELQYLLHSSKLQLVWYCWLWWWPTNFFFVFFPWTLFCFWLRLVRYWHRSVIGLLGNTYKSRKKKKHKSFLACHINLCLMKFSSYISVNVVF